MAFTPETGAGLSGANSFATVAQADAYWNDRGVPSAWGTATETAKEQALVKATDYLNSYKRFPWRGSKKTAAQRLQWPRIGASEAKAVEDLPSDAVPAAVIDATAALAAKVIAGQELQPDLARGGATVREKIDVLEIEYAEGASVETVILEAMDAVASLLRTVEPSAPVGTFVTTKTPAVLKASAFDNLGNRRAGRINGR